MNLPSRADTIVALATPAGSGAIAVIRVSGSNAFTIGNAVFRKIQGEVVDFHSFSGRSIQFGKLVNAQDTIDEVLVSVFKSPASYTGEDTLEISCHGSVYIQQQVLQVLQQAGARAAEAGEFTLRAFLNGKLDLSQAEAVADLIASTNAATHRTALQQLRGGYSGSIQQLREQLLNFASLLELELDFAEEDVEFANRDQLKMLSETLLQEIRKLRKSFESGNVLKAVFPSSLPESPTQEKAPC